MTSLCNLVDNPFGYGTPAQRQRQAAKYRAFKVILSSVLSFANAVITCLSLVINSYYLKAAESVYEHRVGKLTAQYEDRLATRERNTVKKQTTRNQIDRLVEDLITESMANGEFDNLDGAGKPLPNR